MQDDTHFWKGALATLTAMVCICVRAQILTAVEIIMIVTKSLSYKYCNKTYFRIKASVHSHAVMNCWGNNISYSNHL